MRRLFGSEPPVSEPTEATTATAINPLADGALDTLSSVFQTLGDQSFPLDTDTDPHLFPRECAEFVRHIENGEAVPTRSIPRSADGQREWPLLRNFFNERRREERRFVLERIGNYREVVEELIAGLRHIGERDNDTQKRVSMSLSIMEQAVDSGELTRIEAALKTTLERVRETFEEQRRGYEQQLRELNERMSSLRQDLVAAREEMQRDSLTDAYNRGAFDKAISQALNLHFMLQQPVTLVMIDCDRFKEINDSYGHSAGDQVLRAFGECLARSFIRKSDFVARYGGDEFAVILNETNADSAAKIVRRFVDSVARIDVPGGDEGISLTCSVGYTELHESDTVETLLQRADKALYAVKSRGGNGAEYRAFSAPGGETPAHWKRSRKPA
jgi:diguanylate cyclase (GGDEF)-like protein